MGTVRCADCGFLGARLNIETIASIDEKGRNDTYPGDGGKPICIKGLVEFIPNTVDGIKAKFAAERECNGFVKWRPGLSPKEHVQMSIADELRKDAERYQAERDRSARIWTIVNLLIASLLGIVSFLINRYISQPQEQKPPIVNIIVPEQKQK